MFPHKSVRMKVICLEWKEKSSVKKRGLVLGGHKRVFSRDLNQTCGTWSDPRPLSRLAVVQRCWDVALGPLKQIPMNLFIMYMSGNTISIFPIMMVCMMAWRPIQALMSMSASEYPALRHRLCSWLDANCSFHPLRLSLQAAGELQPAVAPRPRLPDRKPPGLGAGHLQVSVDGTAPDTLVRLAGVHRSAAGKVVNVQQG